MKITSDKKPWLLERNVFSSFPENGLKAKETNDDNANKIQVPDVHVLYGTCCVL